MQLCMLKARTMGRNIGNIIHVTVLLGGGFIHGLAIQAHASITYYTDSTEITE